VSYSVKALLKATGFAALLVALAVVLMLGVVGCGEDSSATTVAVTTGAPTTTLPADVAALVGKWYSEKLKETFEFTGDGNMIWTADGAEPMTFPYSLQAGVIVFQQPGAADDNSLPYTVSGNTLTTTDPKYGTVTYTKQ
jgi:hypothetical protein